MGTNESDSEKLIAAYAELAEYFPIGKRLEYYPEYQKDRSEETLILGYCINHLFVFSPNDLSFSGSGENCTLQMKVEDVDRSINRIRTFSVIIPNPRNDEQKWDYTRRAELGKRGLFGKGNSLTLISYLAHSVPIHLETAITRFSRLKDGYYSNVEIAFLEPDLDTLAHKNQRQNYRVQTHIPVSLIMPHTKKEIVGDLLDFSERTARIGFYEPENVIPAVHDRQTFILNLSLRLPSETKEYKLVCETQKIYDSSIVVEIKGIIKNGTLADLNYVDALEIKSQILSHPNTKR